MTHSEATRRIARVLILPAAGDSGPLDYAVAGGMAVEIGMRVLVPLGARQAVGIVVELVGESALAKLRTISAVLEPRPIFDAALIGLCRWMAEYYLSPFADAVTAALPGSVRLKTEAVVGLVAADSAGTEGTSGTARTAAKVDTHADSVDDSVDTHRSGRPLSVAQTAIVEYLGTAGEQPATVLTRRFGAGSRAALAALRRRGIIRVDHRLKPASGRTRHRRFFRVQRALTDSEAAEWAKRRSASFRLYAYLAEHPLQRAALPELDASFPDAGTKLRKLQAAGIVAVELEEVLRAVLPEQRPVDRPVTLSTAQADAVAAIGAKIGASFAPFLLWGVTGSGKTEVYLRAIATCLDAGGSALVLVPEISLTHQLVDRIRARFSDAAIAILHSGLSDGERWDEWRRIAAGDVRVVVGARSAVFAPLKQLMLMVVDEEHDPAYKQEDGVRYNGRDLAVMRAKLAGCPVVLGSATPALETFHNAQAGRYRLLELRERVEARPLRAIELVDLRQGNQMSKATLVSPKLLGALRANVAGGAQSLVFLNRRGFANFLQCHQCGTPMECPNCSVSLTLHQRSQALRCHHCDHTIPVPSSCPSCGGIALGGAGAGTEQVEGALKRLIPGARVARMDRDTTSRKGAQREMLAAWERGDSDILVGTQMIAKGHDVHAVTLVGVLLADSGLNFPDFRAAERTFQTLAQVAGRAGRGTQPGKVLIQTFQPQHPSLKFATHHDYRGFADHELKERRTLGYPPYSRLVQIRCEGENPADTQRLAEMIKDLLASAPAGVEVLGPSLAPLERLRRRYRWQLLLRGRNGTHLRRAAQAAREAVRAQARTAEVRIIVDVDPYDML